MLHYLYGTHEGARSLGRVPFAVSGEGVRPVFQPIDIRLCIIHSMDGLFFLYININLSQSILNCGRIFDICVVSSYNREVKAMLYRSGFYGPVRL